MRHLTVFALSIFTLASACNAQQSGRGTTIVKPPLGTQLDSAIAAAASEGFSGVALVAKNGEVILSKGYGLANRAEKIPMTPATIVQIGSNTKDFTAVAILQLMERGRLRLTDSIGKYFPNVPEDKRGVTINNLLRHTAGFPQHLGPDFDAVTREQEIRNALSAPLKFAPGTSRAYSNVGYSLLGAIIEQMSGKTYDEYVRDEILRPAGLEETGFHLPHFDTKRLAHGYSDNEDRGTMLAKPHASDGPYWNLRANGGMLSTVGDMYRFYQVLAGETLLKPATRDIMFQQNGPVIDAGSDLVNFFMYNREPEAGVVMILASNSTGLNAEKVRGRLAPILGLGGNRERPTTPAALTDLPNTPAANTVRAYFKAFNSGDPAVMGEFMRTSTIQAPGDTRTLDQRLEAYKTMHGDIGDLKLLGMVSSTADELVVRAAAGNGDALTLSFGVESQSPYRLKGIRIEAQ
jgi:CubicO group peptidase (beta-lactamase class C family)